MAHVFAVVLLSYLGRIRIAAGKAMALAVLLLKAAPADLTAQQRKKLSALQKAGAAVEKAQAIRDGGSGSAVQPLRGALAAAFAAPDLMLAGMSLLPGEIDDIGARAQKVRAVIFPDGRAFANDPAVEATMYARRTLARIEEKKLARELKELIGPRFLQNMTAATDALAEALGLGESVKRVPSTRAISTAMDKYTTALAGYTRVLAADVDEDDEASCQRFLAAVAPIDQFRTAHGGAAPPADPTPVVPAPPTSTPATNGAGTP